MCGISGIWSQDQRQNRIREQITEAVATLRHRGPDDEGIWMNQSGVALGHNRLSILDLSDAGHQPMVSEDGRHVIVFNGEIYNFGEIRQRLVAAGQSFMGTGDTEVVLAAFREWGPSAVEQFVGMFAIALWDEQEKRLELVRDRTGVKPLHFGWDGKTLCFASELKALRAFKHWTPTIDLQSLGEFLQYGYIAGNRTIYQGIQKLEPGHRLVLNEGRQPNIERYWSALDAIDRTPTGSDADIEAELEDRLIDAFRYRMVSDVPVGMYLSGGVDSSLVTAILAKHHNQALRTFTIGFSEGSHDESAWAKKVAEHCGTIHTEYTLSVSEALEIARNWGSLFDEPFGDASGIPTFLVSRLASKEVKVVLSADGGDELFSGYKVYNRVLKRSSQLDHVPRWLASALHSSTSKLLPILQSSGEEGSANNMMRRSTTGLRRLGALLRDPTVGGLLDASLTCWKPSEISRLIGDYRSPRASANSYPGPPATKISLWDIENYLPEDVLTKVDRTTMAVSIEGREPLLDHRIVEYALSLPPHLRRGRLGPKHLLKSILYRYVPREIVDRPKQGFGIPLGDWLRTDLKDLVTGHLDPTSIRNAGIMDPGLVNALVTKFYAGHTHLGRPLWFLLAFEMWRKNWG